MAEKTYCESGSSTAWITTVSLNQPAIPAPGECVPVTKLNQAG